ncbi:GNAT family N-acetyltransferase [Prosthecomicrobium sp. N25]|uniref:GNAT family N-acetyltransferase n=1 Tax=Prosthecomicrobium sp. N25 TaxID=3129254 RepID=UPI0030786DEC
MTDALDAPASPGRRPAAALFDLLPFRDLPLGRLPLAPGVALPLPLGPLPGARETSLGRIGSLEVRLARTVGEVRRCQKLRYRVFYEELGAVADGRTLVTGRDADRFDRVCDHMLVVDHESVEPRRFGRTGPRIVGTYRLLRQEAAARAGGFYTASEFDVAPLIARKPGLRFLELGRSCVLPEYRTKRTVELLWHGVWAYVLRHRVDVMIGCASLEGTDPDRLALPLSFLHHHARADAEWRVSARPERAVAMNRLAREAVDARRALQALPPLVKGYLRLGAMIGDGAVVDAQFGTTDVCMILPVARISTRYVNYYGADASRHAA